MTAVRLQGKQLTAGQYTVEVSGEGPNVELNIVGSGKQAVASVPARLVPVSAKNQTSGYHPLSSKTAAAR